MLAYFSSGRIVYNIEGLTKENRFVDVVYKLEKIYYIKYV